MPRYFFNVHDGQDYPDKEGSDLPNLAAARREAVRMTGEILRDKAGHWTGEDWTIIVADDTAKPVLTLRFSGTTHA